MAKYSFSKSSTGDQVLTHVIENKKSSMLPKIAALSFVALLAIAFGVFTFFFWRDSQNEKASVLLSQAMDVYQADLLKENETAEPSSIPRFKTAQERADASLALLSQLVKSYPRSSLAPLSELASADILFDMGKMSEAERKFRLADGAKFPENIRPFLLEGLALSIENQNRKEEALAMYKQEGQKSASGYQSFFQWNEARIQQSMGNQKQASEIYLRLLQLPDWSSSMKIRLQNRSMDLE